MTRKRIARRPRSHVPELYSPVVLARGYKFATRREGNAPSYVPTSLTGARILRHPRSYVPELYRHIVHDRAYKFAIRREGNALSPVFIARKCTVRRPCGCIPEPHSTAVRGGHELPIRREGDIKDVGAMAYKRVAR